MNRALSLLLVFLVVGSALGQTGRVSVTGGDRVKPKHLIVVMSRRAAIEL